MRINICRPILVTGICIVIFSKRVVAEGREQPRLDPSSVGVKSANLMLTPQISNSPGRLERAWSLNQIAKEQQACGHYAVSEALYEQALKLVEGSDKTAAFVT